MNLYTGYFRALIASVFIILNGISLFAQSGGSYNIVSGVQINKANCRHLNKLVVLMPLAQTNQYQTVFNVNFQGATLADIPETDDKYLRFSLFYNEISNQPDTFLIAYDFDIILHTIDFDFSQVTEIFPYDTSSNYYQRHIGDRGIYVLPNHPAIRAAGDFLWVQSSDIVDYARRVYEYVAANFQYLNPLTGLHPLDNILQAGGGDCANLSSVFVSLLRYKNIPARHIVTFRPEGTYHVWVDFYLEKYGWIPVDVTYKHFNPSGDYFGKYDGNGVVVTKEVWLYLERDVLYSVYAPLLQTYYWWYWWGPAGCNAINSWMYIKSKPLSENQLADSEMINLYPNPAFDHLRLSGPPISEDISIEIYSASGMLVYMQEFNHQKIIDISNFKSGIYIVRISTESINISRKFIKH